MTDEDERERASPSPVTGDDERGTAQRRWVKPVAIGVVLVVAIYVLFTWVFPWVTEMGLDPTMG